MPQTQLYLDGVSTLDRSKFFNMHDNHLSQGQYSSSDVDRFTNEFQAGHGRQFWSPMSAARDIINTGTYPDTAYAITNGARSVSQDASNPNRRPDSNRIVMTDHPRNVMTDINDPVAGASWAADYFTYYFDDDSRPLFYEPMNEPFVHADDFQANYNNSQAQVREAMTEWFKQIGREFDERDALQNVSVIGFASAWPSFEFNEFGHWRSRMGMFIDNAGAEMDALSVHLYDGLNVAGQSSQRSGSNASAILDLVEAYSMAELGEVKPHAITEYGTIVDRPAGEIEYDEAVNGQTIKSFNNIVLELLDREDRILTSIPFITGRAQWYWQDPAQGDGHPYNPSMFRPNRNNIELVDGRWQFIDNDADDNYLLNINHLFFEFWKDVSGERVDYQSTDPDILAFAIRNDSALTLILSNLDDVEKTPEIEIPQIPGNALVSVDVYSLSVPIDAAPSLTNTTVAGPFSSTDNMLTLPEQTIGVNQAIKLVFNFEQDIANTETMERKAYYSLNNIVSISASQANSFPINQVDLTSLNADASRATLRMSIARAHSLSKAPVVTVNGTELTVPDDWAGYDQANRDRFFGALEMDVPFDILQNNNDIQVTFSDAGGHISSMILEVFTEIDEIEASSVSIGDDLNMLEGETQQLSAAVLPLNAPEVVLTWSSSNADIATVDQSGLLSAVAAGTAQIMVETQAGLSDSLSVTVSSPPSQLLVNANADFEMALSDTQLISRSTPPQVNLAQVSIDASAAREGSAGGLLIDNTGGSAKLQFVASSIVQSVQAEKTYRIQAYFKVVSGSHQWWTEIENGSGSWKNQPIADTNDWQTLSITYTGAQLGDNFGLNFHVDPTSAGSGGIIYVDDVTIEAID
jgi:hypothetical protein